MFISPHVNPIVNPYPQLFPQQGGIVTPQQSRHAEEHLPRYVNYAADASGCFSYRIGWPEQVINMSGVGLSTSLTAMVFDPKWYRDVKCVKVQRQASTDQKEFIKHLKNIQREHGFKLIYEVDDVVFAEEIPDYNKFKFAFASDEVRNNCIEIINMCDEVTVTCEFMKRLYQEKTGKKEITVVPNFMPYSWIGHMFDRRKIYSNYDTNKKKPRVLYTGSGAHYDVDNKNGGVDDFSHVLDFVRNTLDKYQWVFVGAFPPALRPFVDNKMIEFHPWQSLLHYPRFISNLNAQVMVAPLHNNNFNKSKSDIKLMEACMLGLPCVCQDMETYKNAPEHLKFTTGEDLEQKIDAILRNKTAYYKNVDVYRNIGVGRILELTENIGCHLEALNTPFNSPERKYLRKWN